MGEIINKLRMMIQETFHLPEPETAESTLHKIDSIKSQLQELGAQTSDETFALVLYNTGALISPSRREISIIGFSPAHEAQVIQLLTPLFPNLMAITDARSLPKTSRIIIFVGDA